MNRVITSIALTAALLLCTSGMQAGTIIRLTFVGSDEVPDVELVSEELSTIPDAWGATLGDQNTTISYAGVLGSRVPEVGSVTLQGIKLVGEPMGGLVGFALQGTEGGEFSLWDNGNELLLAGSLGKGTLSGPIGGTATGGFLTTEFGSFTDGLLLPALGSHTLTTLSIGLLDVNDGAGMSLNEDNRLIDFTADASALIGANPIPEPAAVGLLLIGVGALGFTCRPGRSGPGIGR